MCRGTVFVQHVLVRITQQFKLDDRYDRYLYLYFSIVVGSVQCRAWSLMMDDLGKAWLNSATPIFIIVVAPG